MSIDESARTELPETSRELGFTLRSSVDRYCRNCQEVALVYDTAADAARCRVCGELDEVTEQLVSGEP